MMDTNRDERGGGLLSQVLGCSNGTKQDRLNQRRFTFWCIAWAGMLIAASWVLESYDQISGIAAWAIAIVPSVFAIGALFSYLRYLRMADEMQRRMQIEGLAVGFGTGWIFTIGYQVLERAGAPELTVTATILVMTAGWMVGQLLAVWHYR